MILPDYKNNIKNISATFSKFLGKEDGETIMELEEELKKNYKNVVFIVFDGMGVDVLNKIAKNSIMAKNIVKQVTSVFPSTTTNATTTLLTNTLVDSHKYLAWSLYFEQFDRCIDIYMGRDSYTQEEITQKYLEKTVPYFSTFKTNRAIYSVFPTFVHETTSKLNIGADTVEELGKAILNICKIDDQKFVYCYCTEPDSTMHDNGVTSEKSIEMLEKINLTLKNVIENVEDTLIVLTADHGHIDVCEYVDIYKDEDVMNCLARPMSMEPRATSFKLKDGKEDDFLKAMEKYKQDFTLVKSLELIQKGVFGKNIDEQLKSMLGDYIAIGTSTFKCLHFSSDKYMLKGHHTGTTPQEMYVPLIFIKNK